MAGSFQEGFLCGGRAAAPTLGAGPLEKPLALSSGGGLAPGERDYAHHREAETDLRSGGCMVTRVCKLTESQGLLPTSWH